MNLNLRKSMYITFCIATAMLFVVFYIFKDISPKIVLGYNIAYLGFGGVFVICVLGIFISEIKNVNLKYIKENSLTFLGGLAVTTLIFYGMDYLFKPEKLSVYRSLFKGVEGAIGILIVKVMFKDKKTGKSE